MYFVLLTCLVGCLLPQLKATHFEAFTSGLALPPKVETLDSVQTGYFPQILDHYSSTPSYWNQRYFMNTQLWRGGKSPIFLMIGGEGEASPSWMSGGAWYQWAYKHGALLFQLEHRFYGESHPTPDASTANLKYLRSQQALGDIAYFIYSVNQANNFTSATKWILFGGSYPGNLVAWARLKYPNLVFGGISSSGPLQAEVNFSQYFDVVINSLNAYSQNCASQVTKAVQSIQSMLDSGSNGLSTLYSKFPVCSGFRPNVKFDRTVLIQSLTGSIARAVQYNNQLGDLSITKICSYMNNQNVADPVDRLAQLYNATSSGCAYSNYDGLVSYYQSTDWTSTPVSKGSRQWIYQTCNEFGYYQTSQTKSSLLSDAIPLEYSTDLCTKVFGSQFNPTQLDNSVAYTNSFYQGVDIKVTRVVFIHGSIDPWHALGIVKNPTNEDPYMLVQGTSHCYDMLSPSASDPPGLTSARKTASDYIDYWISL